LGKAGVKKIIGVKRCNGFGGKIHESEAGQANLKKRAIGASERRGRWNVDGDHLRRS